MFKNFSIRNFSQIIVFILVLVLAFLHQKFGIEQAASIHAYCPFGALETFFTNIFSGGFIQKIYWSNFILMGIFIVMTIFFGRIFCGFFCPLGAISERLRSLGRKLGIKKDIELPVKLDKYLRYLKYIVLVVVIVFSFKYTALVFDTYDPFSALAHLGNEIEELLFAYIILGLIIITALFSKSRRCRYLCPLGAFFALIKKLSFFKLDKDKSTCVKCGVCDVVCPMNLNLKDYKDYNGSECISCLDCVGGCPKNSLYATIFGKKIKKSIFKWMVVLMFFGALGIVVWTPFWQTKPSSNIVNEQGDIDISGLKGSNTLQYVIDITKIPFDYFQKELSLPADMDRSIKLKEIGITYNIKNIDGDILEMEDIRNIIQKKLLSE